MSAIVTPYFTSLAVLCYITIFFSFLSFCRVRVFFFPVISSVPSHCDHGVLVSHFLSVFRFPLLQPFFFWGFGGLSTNIANSSFSSLPLLPFEKLQRRVRFQNSALFPADFLSLDTAGVFPMPSQGLSLRVEPLPFSYFLETLFFLHFGISPFTFFLLIDTTWLSFSRLSIRGCPESPLLAESLISPPPIQHTYFLYAVLCLVFAHAELFFFPFNDIVSFFPNE